LFALFHIVQFPSEQRRQSVISNGFRRSSDNCPVHRKIRAVPLAPEVSEMLLCTANPRMDYLKSNSRGYTIIHQIIRLYHATERWRIAEKLS